MAMCRCPQVSSQEHPSCCACGMQQLGCRKWPRFAGQRQIRLLQACMVSFVDICMLQQASSDGVPNCKAFCHKGNASRWRPRALAAGAAGCMRR
eukprot:366207-Chlamydomonas_euryale.AAC.7